MCFGSGKRRIWLVKKMLQKIRLSVVNRNGILLRAKDIVDNKTLRSFWECHIGEGGIRPKRASAC